jgi:hypothetical protein
MRLQEVHAEKGEGELMQSEAVRELVAAAELSVDGCIHYGIRKRLREAIVAVKAEEKPQTLPLHYHEAKYIDGELVRECNKCGQDLMHFSHRRSETAEAPINQTGDK